MDDPWICNPEMYDTTTNDPWMGDPTMDPYMDPYMGDPTMDPYMDPYMGDPTMDPYMDPYMGDPTMDPSMSDPTSLDDSTLPLDPTMADPSTPGPDPGFGFDFDFEDPTPAPAPAPTVGSPSATPGTATTRSLERPDFTLAEFDMEASEEALTRGGDALEPATIIDLALTSTAHELAHLAALDAFADDLDADAQAIVDQVGLAPAPRLVAVPALVEVDDFGVRVLAAMRDAGLATPPAVRQALSGLTEPQLDAIEQAGAAPGLDPSRYARAYELLAGAWVELQPEPDTTTTDVESPDELAFADDVDPAETIDEAAQAEADETDETEQPEPAGGIAGGLLVGGAIAAVLGLLGLVSRWRGSRRSGGAGDTVADLVEVSRLLNGARSEAEVGRIVVAEASRITSGEAALYCGRTTGDLVEIAASAAFPSDPVLAASELERVLDLASPGTFAVDGLDVVAVPVIESGTVGGVLLSTGPLTSEQRREQNLRRLASIAGASLAAARRQRELEDLSSIDALTGLANRRRLDEDLAAALRSPDAAPVSFVMIDVDHFKTYNDTHGHAAGDVALATVARVLTEAVGEAGTAYRYGGEEFCVLCPATATETAVEIAEAIRSAIEAEAFPGEERQPDGRVTASLGVAEAEPDSAAGDLIEAADQALYRAKHDGRNAVAVAEPAAS
ncbi:MAG: GGDEF domain-containing protein [Acidimicrobiales bacterium]